jgi:predicted permease
MQSREHSAGPPRADRRQSEPLQPGRLRILDELVHDVRFGARGLRKSPSFAALAIVALALAIGANAAIFALVDVLMLRPLGLHEPERLIRVFGKKTTEPDVYRSFSYPNYVDLRDGATSFEEIAAFTPSLVGLDRGDGTTRREFAQLVTASYFSTLGAEPAMGRTFTVEEEKPNAAIRAVIVSHAFWARAGADPAPLGKPLEINGEEYTVVGVAPEGFGGVSALLTTDLWLPLGVYGTSVGQFMASAGGDLAARDRHELMVIGRLRRGLTAEQALPELEALAARMAGDSPDVNRDYTLTLAPQPRFSFSSRPTQDTAFTAASAVMMAMAGIVLLVACLNLANMFLAHGAARRTEIAIRQSLGGGRVRILRQLLTEGLLLSLAGGALGLVLGVSAAQWVVASIVPVLPFGSFALRVGPDLRVVLATLAFCALSTLLFGLGPSLALVRSAVIDDLKDGAARLAGVGRRRLVRKGRRPKLGLMPRNTLVVAQIALSLALVTAAGLFLRSAQRARSYQPEFAVDGRLLVETDAALASLDEPRARELYRQVLERMRARPGVESVALASNVPFSSISEGESVRMTGARQEDEVDAEYYVVTPGYFDTMGLAMLRGRDFHDGEAEPGTTAGTVIIDEPLARRLRPDGDVLGRSLLVETSREAEPTQTVEIVGIVPGVRRGLFDREASPTVYLPFGRNYRAHMIVHLRLDRGGEDAAAGVLESVGREIRGIDPRLPILSMKTLGAHLEQGIERWMVRTAAGVFAVLGGVAVLLALIGVYGVKSYVVSRRTREIGIRMALGATPRDILSWMLHDGLISTAAGLGLGILLALGIGRVLSSALYGVGGVDLLTFVAAPALLAAAALLAAYLPSRRATRLAPSVALRQD